MPIYLTISNISRGSHIYNTTYGVRKKTTTFVDRNQIPGQAQKYGRVKPVNGITTNL
jgi:hypothetical protein